MNTTEIVISHDCGQIKISVVPIPAKDPYSADMLALAVEDLEKYLMIYTNHLRFTSLPAFTTVEEEE